MENIRIFNSKKGKWQVTFFSMPNFSAGSMWEGEMKEGKMVLWKGDANKGSRLTFYNITIDGYQWIGENFSNGKASAFWKEKATRR